MCEVVSPLEVVRIGDAHNLYVTPNGGICCTDKVNELRLPVCVGKCTREDPLAVSLVMEILVLDPSFPFVWVSALCPLPEYFEDCIVH
jgi:hypothetical protein